VIVFVRNKSVSPYEKVTWREMRYYRNAAVEWLGERLDKAIIVCLISFLAILFEGIVKSTKYPLCYTCTRHPAEIRTGLGLVFLCLFQFIKHNDYRVMMVVW
jgi:hypothetical protein